MRSPEVDAIAERVLGATLGQAGFESAAIEERPNHADEDALFITVRFRPGAEATPGRLTGEAIGALRDALETIGEHRFPYLIYDYPDSPAPFADDEDAEG